MKLKMLVLFQLIFFWINCNSRNDPGLFIDLSSLRFEGSVKIILLKFNRDGDFTHEWIKVDSITTNEKRVNWAVKYDHPFLAQLSVIDSKKHIIGFLPSFIYSESHLNIGTDKNIKVYNNSSPFIADGRENELYNKKQGLFKRPHFKNDEVYYNAIKNNYKPVIDDPQLISQVNEYEENVLGTVKEYHNYYFTVLQLMDIAAFLSTNTLEKCYNELDANLRHTIEGQRISNFIDNNKLLFNGKNIPPFVVKDKNDKEISSDKILKGKYHFINFWASGCAPCIDEIRDLKLMYNGLDTNKIQIVSLSLNSHFDDWLKASDIVKINWPSYVQANNGNQSLMKIFSLGYIPQSILINEQGVIVNHNLNMHQLSSFIKSNRMLVTN
ncbi:TlpA family protein disulfide reductase [Mucilaginibacter angelicae]|uniref:TlpA family protein disulfide reductase n=1 Tax=Mucilaginibacter angelicae TaxID=869718 RepID=A0ABV6L060_9SPHI